MGSYYDEIEIEDMVWDDEKRVYHYPCPCGDRFEISKGQLANYEDIAACPSCSLVIRVIYDPLDFEDYDSDEEEGEGGEEGSDTEEDSNEDDVERKENHNANEDKLVTAMENLNVNVSESPSDRPQQKQSNEQPALAVPVGA